MAFNAVRYVIRKKHVSAKEKWVLVCIANHYSVLTGKCEPSLEQLRLDTNLTKKSLKMSIKILEELEELEVDRPSGKGVKNKYTIVGLGGKDTSGKKRPTQKFEYMFEGFWKVYPRKVQKKRARAAYLKLNPTQGLHTRIIKHIRLRNHHVWDDTEDQFIMHATTFINGECWDDELDKKKEKPNVPLT